MLCTLQAGISLVGVSRVLAGGDSGSADSLEQQPQYATSAAPSAWQALNEGGAGPPDPKKALLGMCLILLSQVSFGGRCSASCTL